MGQLQERYKNYREPQKFMKAGVYPYFREITSKQSTEVTDINGHKILMFGSNAYTGLTNDQRVIDAAKAALDKYGSGCAGSRFLNGTLDIHVRLEKELAEFEHKDDALCFSMEGDLAKLPEIVELKKKYNCSLMVDEAHGLGVFGKQGRGVCDYFGVTDDVDLIMGTFSKSLASVGGFIAGDRDTINYIRHTCRTYIFSASDTPAATAAAMEALHIIKTEPERQQHLWDVTKYALKRFREEGFEIGDTESPIIPLYVRDINKTFLVTKLAYDAGVFINPVIPPACAPQDTLVRFALMATHTEEQVEAGVQRLKKIFVEQGIIK